MNSLLSTGIKTEGSSESNIKTELKDLLIQAKTAEEKCDECELVLKNKESLRNHIKVVHVASRPFSCDICNASFKSKAHLACHTVIHSDKKPFSCEICEKTFKLLQSKVGHMKTHSKNREKTKFCPECGNGFFTN